MNRPTVNRRPFGKLALLFAVTSFLAFMTGCSSLNLVNDEIEQSPIVLVTATPVVESIAHELIDNTELSLLYLPPTRYSLKRIPAWIQRQDKNSLPQADVLLGISSVWPSFDLYPALRARNINIIPVDAAYALIPGGERVAITPTDKELPEYFWLNPSNALVMTGIIYRDLLSIIAGRSEKGTPNKHKTANKRETPNKRETIQTLKNNYLSITQTLRTVQTQVNQILAESDYMQSVAHSSDLDAMQSVTFLPPSSLEQASVDIVPTLLITNRKTSHRSLSKLPAHIAVWHIDDFSKPAKESFSQRWTNNLRSLQSLKKNKVL